MMGWFRAAAVSAASAALLAGCGGSSDDFVVRRLAFADVERSSFSSIEAFSLAAVYDAVTWNGLWEQHTVRQSPRPPLPAVDFARQSVAAVFLGAQTRCLRPEIVGVDELSTGDVRVTFRVVGPGPTELCAAAVTAPSHMVRFDNSPRKAIVFEQV